MSPKEPFLSQILDDKYRRIKSNQESDSNLETDRQIKSSTIECSKQFSNVKTKYKRIELENQLMNKIRNLFRNKQIEMYKHSTFDIWTDLEV